MANSQLGAVLATGLFATVVGGSVLYGVNEQNEKRLDDERKLFSRRLQQVEGQKATLLRQKATLLNDFLDELENEENEEIVTLRASNIRLEKERAEIQEITIQQYTQIFETKIRELREKSEIQQEGYFNQYLRQIKELIQKQQNDMASVLRQNNDEKRKLHGQYDAEIQKLNGAYQDAKQKIQDLMGYAKQNEV